MAAAERPPHSAAGAQTAALSWGQVQQEAANTSGHETFQLRASMVNFSCWATMQYYLLHTKANVVFGVELHTIGEATIKHRHGAKNNGLKSLWVDALPAKTEPYSS